MTEQVLAGRYELSDRLGLGGMAEVHLGKDRVLGRTVAVKTLLAQFATDPAFIARFRREATSAAALNHPHIVGVYDTGSDDGRHYIVMEYVEGRTLKDVIREEGPLLPERAAEIAADVCSALQFAHAHGIVHRDIKPANIMMNTRGEVKVADFGIARAISGETVTQTATVLGTAQYFSPEQAQAAPVDARSDLYSLGVVLYEMLTRQVPFTGTSPVSIAYKHVKEDAIPPSRLNADVPASLEAVVMKSLAKNPDNRYQSAQDMRQDLERAIRGLPISAPALLRDAEHTAVMSAPADDSTVMIRRPVTGGRTVARPAGNSRRGLGILLLTLIFFAMVGIIIWALLSSLPQNSTVTVKDVTNRSVADATAILQGEGFTVVVDPAISDDIVPKDQVIKTDPTAGVKAPKGSAVHIVPSAGKEQVEVPDLKGKTLNDALAAIAAANLQTGTIKRQFDDAPKDTVIAQSPGKGTLVPKFRKVDLTISDGPEIVTVPDVRGETEARARRDLERAGFQVVAVQRDQGPDCGALGGVVCDQDPKPGTQQPKNSRVTIYVAREPNPPPSDSPPPTQ